MHNVCIGPAAVEGKFGLKMGSRGLEFIKLNVSL